MSLTTSPLTLEGGDPRAEPKEAVNFSHSEIARPDTDVSFGEYLYYASITRAEEKLADEQYRQKKGKGPTTGRSLMTDRFPKGLTGRADGRVLDGCNKACNEGSVGENVVPVVANSDSAVRIAVRDGISEGEWKSASRAARTAGWGSVFFLITTDILGPSSAPWSFAQMGYGPGFTLYTVFGVLSAYSGWILWKIFIELDSDRYPTKNYADIFMRCFGPGMKHFVNVSQAIQLIAVLSFIILLNGQSISQISQGLGGTLPGICFVTCLLIFMFAGFLVGQIRTLQRLSWLANFAVWLNLLVVLIIMGLAAQHAPNFDAVMATFGPDWTPGPILTFAGTPSIATGGSGFIASVNGLNQTFLCYGGAALFVFFLAEMRHPLDFWKSLICAQTFIYGVYVVYGMEVYHFHGQYTYNPAVQGISDRKWQTALNAMNLVTSLIACGMYGNIGLKIAYIEVFEALLHFPPLTSKRGKIWWAALTPLYWILGFVLAAAVPQLALVTGLTGAIFGGGFTFIMPALAAISFWVQRDAIVKEAERFDPTTKMFNQIDHGFRRYCRGFMKRPLFNAFNIVYFLGGLVTCGLGCYSAIVQLMAAFESGVATSFTCKGPV